MQMTEPTRLLPGDRVSMLVIPTEPTDEPRWPTAGLGTVGYIELVSESGADDAQYVDGPEPGLIVALDVLRAAWSTDVNGNSTFRLRVGFERLYIVPVHLKSNTDDRPHRDHAAMAERSWACPPIDYEQTMRVLHALVGRPLTVQVATIEEGDRHRIRAQFTGTLKGARGIGTRGWESRADESRMFWLDDGKTGFFIDAADFRGGEWFGSTLNIVTESTVTTVSDQSREPLDIDMRDPRWSPPQT